MNEAKVSLVEAGSAYGNQG